MVVMLVGRPRLVGGAPERPAGRPNPGRYPVVVPEPEHPAAKAGRFVRAAGLALQREVEKRTPAAPAAPRLEPPPPPPPPPPVPTRGVVGRVVFSTFVLSVVAFLLVVLHVEMALGGAKNTFRLVLAAIMLLEAGLLTTNKLRANERLAQRLANRMWGPRGAANRRERFFARFSRDALTLLGILFLAAGAFELLEATVGY